MKFTCPHCSQRIEADEGIGRSIDCPTCGRSFVIQSQQGVVSPLPAAPKVSASATRAPQPKRPGPPTRPTTSYTPPERRKSPGFGKYLLIFLVLAIGGFGYATHKLNESPQQVWKRLADFITGSEELPPVPTPAPTPMPAPLVTKHEPAPPPEPAPTPAPDPVAWLVEHKDYWPKEVALLKDEDFPVVFNEKVSGSARVPAGTVVKLVELGRETVGVVYGGGGARVPIAATDLRQRAEAAKVNAAADAAVSAATPEAPVAVATPTPAGAFPVTGSQMPTTLSNEIQAVDTLLRRRVTLTGSTQLRVTGTGNPLEGSVVNFTSPDAWLFMEKIRPSEVAANFLSLMWIKGAPAVLDTNVRVVQYGSGTVVIPHGPDFAAMTVFQGKSFTGSSMPLQCHVNYDDASLGAMKTAISSFRLKRGYMVTLAQEENGSGISKNYVAQDHDIEVSSLPAELDKKVRFIRIFPWRWVSKKGVAGGIWQKLNVGWYYNWNIGDNSSLDLEYVPIKQKRWWPGLNQDWKAKGSTHLLGYNEPDHKDQANLSVDDAIAGWPDLLSTGLRVGSPAVSDGGLGWLYNFIEAADAAHLRVDFVAVHYYRAVSNPSNAKGAASQFYNFLKGIHDRVKRPIWVTEWNNGANWTGHEPTYSQEKAAIEEMIKMLDKTPFVERYAIYNWVQDVRNVQRKDGSLTPAGEVYRDKVSPLSYVQAKP